jgi:hypothetical protein
MRVEEIDLVAVWQGVTETVSVDFGLRGILAERRRRSSEHAGRCSSKSWVMDRSENLDGKREVAMSFSS